MQISFHDPDGAVFDLDGRIVRRVAAAAGERLTRFLSTDLATELQAQGHLVQTRSTARPALLPARLPTESDGMWFEHQRVATVSYAHEWVPEMLLAAAELTLELALRLRQAGWDLKDGTASNVVFEGTRPVFVDLCSIVERSSSSPSWWPAGQFERHFVLPLIACTRFGLAPDKLHRSHGDGLPPAELYRMAGWSRWFSPQMLRHCTLPTLAASAASAAAVSAPSAKVKASDGVPTSRADANVTAQDWQLRSLVRTLRNLAQRLPKAASAWQSYVETRHHYADLAVSAKRQAIERWMDTHRPEVVLDLGANTGEFSVLCARRGARVIALERDVESARAAHGALLREAPNGLVLVQDITQPSPAMGWRYAERRPLAQRLDGQADCVLCLALVHHLLVSGGIPLDEILAQVARYSRRLAVIEFVGPQDAVFEKISRQRGLRFDGLDFDRFLYATQAHFRVLDQLPVPGTTRVLLLLERRP